jgi:non-ribosomal peptide synthetase component F
VVASRDTFVDNASGHFEVPVERVVICLNDAYAFCLVTAQTNVAKLDDIDIQIFVAELLLLETVQNVSLRRPETSSYDPAYVIYTSGSTGKPKGILRNICHFLRSENSLLEINRNDRVYQGFSVAFDMSFEEMSNLVGASPVASTERASNRSTCSAKRID